MAQSEDRDMMLDVMEKNAELLQENNKILKKLYKQNFVMLVLRIVWYTVLIGLPFALYFYILEPYFNAFGSNYEVFRAGIGELPGLKGLQNLFP